MMAARDRAESGADAAMTPHTLEEDGSGAQIATPAQMVGVFSDLFDARILSEL